MTDRTTAQKKADYLKEVSRRDYEGRQKAQENRRQNPALTLGPPAPPEMVGKRPKRKLEPLAPMQSSANPPREA